MANTISPPCPLSHTSTPLENFKSSYMIPFDFRKSTLTAMQMIREGGGMLGADWRHVRDFCKTETMTGGHGSEHGEAATDS